MSDSIARVLKSEQGIAARDVIRDLHELIHLGAVEPKWSKLLLFLSEYVFVARTKSGARILDASDFAAWLRELAEEADKLQ